MAGTKEKGRDTDSAGHTHTQPPPPSSYGGAVPSVLGKSAGFGRWDSPRDGGGGGWVRVVTGGA